MSGASQGHWLKGIRGCNPKDSMALAQQLRDSMTLAPRTATTWPYEDNDLEGIHRRGILWVDSMTRQVSWQCGCHSSPWHGHWQWFDVPFLHLRVHFDCRGRHDRLKVTQMFPQTNGTWRGYD